MGLFRTAARAVLWGGAAAGAAYLARRQGLLGGEPGRLPGPGPAPPRFDTAPPPPAPIEDVEPSAPEPEPEVATPPEADQPTMDIEPVEPETVPEPEPPLPEPAAAEEEEVEVVTAEARPADVTDVVDDLLGPADSAVMDAEVVESAGGGDTAIAGAVRAAMPEGVEVEVRGGVVHLRGELEPAERIIEAERRAIAVDGVERVQNLLHLPGTPAPRE